MFSNDLYSEYDSCTNGKSCIDHPYYPFNVTYELSRRVYLKKPFLKLPNRAQRYEEMGISLDPRTDGSYDFYYRSNYYPVLSEVRFGHFDPDFSNTPSTYPVPGIPADPEDRTGIYWGPEDPRLFKDPKGRSLLIYSRRDKDDVRAMYIFNTVTEKEVKLYNFGVKTHKNWTPVDFISDDELVLYYSMQPVELVKCNIISGKCSFIIRSSLSFFPRGIVLRGGTAFTKYREDYYYSFARSVDRTKLKEGRKQKYRPVFMIIKFDKATLKVDHVYVSSAFDFFGIPEEAIDKHKKRDDPVFDYMLPYSAVVRDQDMIITLNLNDSSNVVLRLHDVIKNIDAIINQYETVDCDKQLADMGWRAVMVTNDPKLFRCKERLRSIWRVAADDVLWNNSASCLATNATDSFLTPVMLGDLQRHKNVSHFNPLNKSKYAIRPTLAKEAVRLCREKRKKLAQWVMLSDEAKKDSCAKMDQNSDEERFKCSGIDRNYYAVPSHIEPENEEPSTIRDSYTDIIKRNAGTILGVGGLASVAVGSYLRQRESVPQGPIVADAGKITSPSTGQSTRISWGKVIAIVAGILFVVGAIFVLISRGRRANYSY